MTQQTTGVNIPHDDESKRKIRIAMDEISSSMTRIESERDLIKDIVAEISDKYQLPKKYVSKMARMHHKQNFDQVEAENEDIAILYETVTKKASV